MTIGSINEHSSYTVQSLGKALNILECITEHKELGTRELARMTGYNRSSVHRMLVTFQKHGYLVQNSENNKYRLGMKFLKLGTIAVQRFDIRAYARPAMKALSAELNESIIPAHSEER